jgi:hypothetical protein
MSKHGEMEFRVSALNDLREQFVQALEADVVVAPQPITPRRSFEWRRAWAVPAVVLAVAVLLIAITAIPFKSNPTVAEATADVAKTALAVDYPPDNWFTFTRSRQTVRGYPLLPLVPSRLSSTERRAWLSVERRGTIETRLLDEPKAPLIIYRYPAYGKYQIGDQTYTRAQIDALAEAPEQMIEQINQEAASVGHGQGPATKWTIITQALRDLSPPLPATLRAALIQDLATVEGVSVLDRDEDPRGRAATGFTFVDTGTLNTVYFDSSTSALIYSDIVVIGREAFIAGQDVRIGDLLERFELLESRATPIAPQLKVSD